MIARPRNHSPLRRAIGLAIRRRREALGLTLDQLAARCGCSRSTLQRWECGAASVDAIERTARALRLRARDLLPEGSDG